MGRGSFEGFEVESDISSEGEGSEKEDHDAEAEKAAVLETLAAEFEVVLKRWFAHLKHFDWQAKFQQLQAIESVEVLKDFMFLEPSEIGKLYKEFEGMKFVHKSGPRKGETESMFGLLPQMAMNSAFQIGSLAAESICERVISEANRTVTDLNEALKSDEVEMLVMLRMNNDFINFMIANYRDEFKEWAKLAEGCLAAD
mmetsp:Transcript_35777/g.88008  ORF Transcript_35777/g.88008 Transcript_35777/m.88008 type:complete len:199 (+) Transcript_35777:242-838(+)|eukprot:CAMPEP_0206222408 /NCGR_PEP_ID=MMETSP0047_2-20121206/5942_1 /ASSEMBLY_ACC=CAM_ASM_000192 /TAXON_ID=195065 /ORGANISM="Chroomonas mesostigmatica_cf, Strain CCMP1168" /LENGTH=198 /DNA_ID=CAMNT_0053645227 /DNA_START=179 /DNA_END=775 /DNA_ORIENTATION=-